MGSNHCKELGIRPNKPIGSKDLELIWLKYGEVDGCLSEKMTLRMLQDLAAALEIPFSHSIANQLLERCQTRVFDAPSSSSSNSSKRRPSVSSGSNHSSSSSSTSKKKIMFAYEDLLKTFFNHADSHRVQLTQSANAKLEDYTAHGELEDKDKLLSPEEMLQIFIDEENEKAAAAAKVAFESKESNAFDLLPVEIIVHIFNYLDDKSFCSAREACRTLRFAATADLRIERRAKRLLRVMPSQPRWAWEQSARLGDLDVLKWLHNRDIRGCTPYVMDYAATAGHLLVVKWLYANRKMCTRGAYEGSLNRGHQEVYQWLQKYRPTTAD